MEVRDSMSEQAILRQKPNILGIFKKTSNLKAQEASSAIKNENYQEITQSVNDAYNEWQNALHNFENAESKEMVDYYAYRIKASQIRYDYMIKKAKEALDSVKIV